MLAQVARRAGSTNSEYSIELIPAPGNVACDPADPVNSMVDEGNIKIRVDRPGQGHHRHPHRHRDVPPGRVPGLPLLHRPREPGSRPTSSGPPGRAGSRATDSSGNPTGGDDLLTWAGDKCQRHWWGTPGQRRRGPPEKPTWRGQYLNSSGGYDGDAKGFDDRYDDVDTDDICGEITFITGDEVNGPFHSNDDILVSGTPRFGTPSGNDRVEISGTGLPALVGQPAVQPEPAHRRRRAGPARDQPVAGGGGRPGLRVHGQHHHPTCRAPP